ncbi:(2Fe-2S)-binding protein [Hydrogenimonas urashimensis]|uniref:(2Fe-2S)-binding protein n=1 Tax=Hydrogenimonas urashimensis TaxID=2740515 RepID=UPI0019158351|nr:(2Fe-2S)-binding protein [Hydrogenimonas urashimensis]
MRFFTKIKCFDDATTLDDDDLICYCIEVDKKSIVEAIRNGATDLKAIKEKTGACSGHECAEKNPNGRCCSKEIRQLIDLYCKRV